MIIINDTTKKVLGKVKVKPAATWKLVEERRNFKPKRRENAESRRHYNFLCREIKRQSQLDKDSSLRSLCEQVEKAHMQKKSIEICDGVRRITGKRAPKVRVIKDKNGKVLTNQEQVKKQVERTFSRVIQPTDCDRSICAHGDASGRSERRSNSKKHNRGNAGSHSQIEKT